MFTESYFRGTALRLCVNVIVITAVTQTIYVLITVQRDPTQSSLFINLKVHSTFRVSTTPMISSTQNCNYSLQYCAAAFL